MTRIKQLAAILAVVLPLAAVILLWPGKAPAAARFAQGAPQSIAAQRAPQSARALPGELIMADALPATELAVHVDKPEPDGRHHDSGVAPRDAAVSLGEFKLYAYCACTRCCGDWADGITASGTTATAGRTVAVDPAVIPLGSLLLIDGFTYIAEDTGAGIDGRVIDIYMDSHEAALDFGVRYAEVWAVQP